MAIAYIATGMEIGRPDAFVSRRPRWRLPPAIASGLLGLAILAMSGCAPSRPDPAALEQQAESIAATPQSAAAPTPRHRRTGPHGGPIARIGAALSLTGPAKMFGAAQRSGI